MLALVAIHGWHLRQLDVSNAFLHGELNEEVYMQLPPRMQVSHPNQVCQLQRSLYGLKQASRQWFHRLSSFLLTHGFTQASADHSLFLCFNDTSFTALLVYVDDIVLTGNDIMAINRITIFLDQTFKIKDLGTLKFFLGMEVARSQQGIHLCQRKYVLDILFDSGMLACRLASTPMDSSTHLQAGIEDPLSAEDSSSYRRLVGRLIYLTNTRPDISYAMQQLSQFMANPTTDHSKAASRVLHYLKSSPGCGIFFPTTGSTRLQAFSDSD